MQKKRKKNLYLNDYGRISAFDDRHHYSPLEYRVTEEGIHIKTLYIRTEIEIKRDDLGGLLIKPVRRLS
jgi:hypothetical protein